MPAGAEKAAQAADTGDAHARPGAAGLTPIAPIGAGTQAGEIWLIGAGPGDPELLTIKAWRLLQQADVLVCDQLVPDAILDLAHPQAERMHVGKARGRHTMPQPAINQLLVDLARQGKRVARVKGGDPFIFGRGGEEMEAALAAGVPCTVVPGITAATGCAAAAGIPLTHRDHAQSVRFVTGHTREGALSLDWPALVSGGQTLVFYMGLSNVAEICRQLVRHGLRDSMPVAIVERGTRPDQRVITGSLRTLPALAAACASASPALLIVGTVVSLRATLLAAQTWQRQVAPPARSEASVERIRCAVLSGD